MFKALSGFGVVAFLVGGCVDKGGDDTGGAQETGGGEDTGALVGADLVGTWASAGCEAWPDGSGGYNYLTRTFTLTESSWNLELVIYGDDACSYPLFTAVIDGPYTLLGLSEIVDGATEGNFGLTTNVWTAHDAGMADYFTASGCGSAAWEIGVPQDVSATGCIGVAHPVADCPQEYDVVGVDGDELRFGERVTDMCTEEGRPSALGSYAVTRQ